MATIVFLEHALQDSLGIRYMAHEFIAPWERAGHRVLIHRGTAPPPPGDIAILHVDLTVVPEPYLEVMRRYPRVVNGATGDIRKSRYSDCILARGDPWDGRVLIKTEGNHGGHVDDALLRMAIDAGIAEVADVPTVMDHYYLCDSTRHVPDAIWSTPGVIVEKYIPEEDESGNHIRVWTFFGGEDRSSRYRARVPLIRFADYIDREAVPVPDEMRAKRARLGFDFGKFDYVMHDGRCHLLDANRTPGAPEAFVNDAAVRASLDQLAGGIEMFLR
ncbi:MAG: hypothetical protein ACXWF0_16470 [Usitatibacter sp.]